MDLNRNHDLKHIADVAFSYGDTLRVSIEEIDRLEHPEYVGSSDFLYISKNNETGIPYLRIRQEFDGEYYVRDTGAVGYMDYKEIIRKIKNMAKYD